MKKSYFYVVEVPFCYIGVAQALFAALIVFMKRPLRVADKIMGVWLIVIAYMFAINIIRRMSEIDGGEWVLSLSISITFPPFLYLYSKYVTVETNFVRSDLWHVSPAFITGVLIVLFRNPTNTDVISGINYFSGLIWLRNFIGIVFVLILWIYGALSLIKVKNYKKQLNNIYSYESDRISLSWLRLVVILFVVIYNSIIITGALDEIGIIDYDTNLIRNIGLLVFVYVVSILGYQQNQLTLVSKDIRLNENSTSELNNTDSIKYLKSGLKDDQANEYLQKIVQYMNRSEAWMNSELSVGELSRQTHIPKHHITQTLNENLQKNFYTFVNEYRTEYAKKLIKSPEYNTWSFVAIAFECGFNSKTVFNNFFKKYTGMTPSEYKKS